MVVSNCSCVELTADYLDELYAIIQNETLYLKEYEIDVEYVVCWNEYNSIDNASQSAATCFKLRDRNDFSYR